MHVLHRVGVALTCIASYELEEVTVNRTSAL